MKIDLVSERIWLICMLLLLFKTLIPDVTMSAFKWRLARDARKALGHNYAVANAIVEFFDSENWMVCLAAVPCLLAVAFLRMPQNYHFQAMTFTSFLMSAAASVFGALGDRARAQTLT